MPLNKPSKPKTWRQKAATVGMEDEMKMLTAIRAMVRRCEALEVTVRHENVLAKFENDMTRDVQRIIELKLDILSEE
jgi:hypothetical protein